MGSQGRDVQELQRRLNLCKTSLPRLAEDRIFGPKTLARVKEFQVDNSLFPDGIVGPDTEQVLIYRTPEIVSQAEVTMIYLKFEAGRSREY